MELVLFLCNHTCGGKKMQINEYIAIRELAIGRYLLATKTGGGGLLMICQTLEMNKRGQLVDSAEIKQNF